MANVGEAALQPGEDVDLTRAFFLRGRVAEPAPRLGIGAVGVHSGLHEIVPAFGEVMCEFAVKIASDLVSERIRWSVKRRYQDMGVLRSGVLEDACDALGESAPAGVLMRKLTTAGGGQRVKPGFAIRLGHVPDSALEPSVLLHSVEGGVQRSLPRRGRRSADAAWM